MGQKVEIEISMVIERKVIIMTKEDKKYIEGPLLIILALSPT